MASIVCVTALSGCSYNFSTKTVRVGVPVIAQTSKETSNLGTRLSAVQQKGIDDVVEK